MNQKNQSQEFSSDNTKIKEKMKSFSELLDSIDSLEDKKKALWKEIYEYAISDRDNAYVMFVKLYELVKDDSVQHSIHGTTITKYLERMNKANDQLIKLAELIAAADKKSDTVDMDSIYSEIKKSK